MKQVDKKSYKFEKYSYPERWGSYFYQIKEAIRFSPNNILEIGVGDQVLGSYIKNNTDISYTSLDVAEDLHPDTTGSVTAIPFGDGSFDVVVGYEVLEHIPFEDFEKALSEISRVSKTGAIISLPHFGPSLKFSFKIPFIKEIKIAFKIPYPKKHVFNGQHYWEIGKKGFGVDMVKKSIKKYFDIIQDYVPWENQYHHFFILKKSNPKH